MLVNKFIRSEMSTAKFKSAANKVKVVHVLSETPASKYEHADAKFSDDMFWTLRYNMCTQFGIQQTMAPITRSVSHNVEGVELDEFGNLPSDFSDSATPVIKLDPELAFQLSVRMEEAGKSFTVPALDWSSLERAEHSIPLVRRVSGRPEEPAGAASLLSEGEARGGDWVLFSFDADESWAFVELLCEARGGVMTLLHGRRGRSMPARKRPARKRPRRVRARTRCRTRAGIGGVRLRETLVCTAA